MVFPYFLTINPAPSCVIFDPAGRNYLIPLHSHSIMPKADSSMMKAAGYLGEGAG